MDRTYIYGAMVVFSAIMIFLRALPFIFLGGREKLPDWLIYISNQLPGAIMAILVIYNLRQASLTQPPYAIPEIGAVLATVIIHRIKDSTILTLLVGTGVYVILLAVLT